MKKFKKIRQYKDCIKSAILHFQYVGNDDEGRPIYDESAELPILCFQGTEKLHGTNAGIRYDVSSNKISFQSRERMISVKNDNAGFAAWGMSHADCIKQFMSDQCCDNSWDNLTIFGEWCGGSIQKGVALNQLDKRFVVFAAYADQGLEDNDGEYVDMSNFPVDGLPWDCIFKYPLYYVDVDLNNPGDAIEEITKLTEEVEKCSPYGKANGVEGIGEGIVWTHGSFCFKSKGEAHSKGGGKKASIDPIKAANVAEFVEKTVTPDRLNQCWTVVGGKYQPPRMENLGEMMKWIYNDIIDEEGDALAHNDLCAKDVSGAISNAARPWLIEKINEF